MPKANESSSVDLRTPTLILHADLPISVLHTNPSSSKTFLIESVNSLSDTAETKELSVVNDSAYFKNSANIKAPDLLLSGALLAATAAFKVE